MIRAFRIWTLCFILSGCYESHQIDFFTPQPPIRDAAMIPDATTVPDATTIPDTSTPSMGCDDPEIPEAFRCKNLYLESWTGGCDHGYRFRLCANNTLVTQHVDCTAYDVVFTGTWQLDDDELTVTIEPWDPNGRRLDTTIQTDCSIDNWDCAWTDRYLDEGEALICPTG